MTTTFNKRQLASGISVAAIAAALSFATPAQAQTTSTVRGHVEGAAAGSVVTVTDLNTNHSDTARTDANGNYLIAGLPPSTYRVESAGKAQTVVVPLGQAVTVDLAAPATSTAAAIVIVGARTKDVKTPSVATNVSRFQIENLPNGDRNFLNFAALAPGVTVSPPQLGGHARQVQAGAINSDNTNTYIDGLSIKNLVNHGGTLGQNISSGNPFPASAVDQFNVETQNFAAEFGDAASAVISTVTKTGGNEFHGEIFGEWQPKSFISRNYDDRTGHLNNPTGARPKPDFQTKYYGGDIGGPIIKDKLTFFLDFEGTNKTFGSNDINVYPAPLAGLSTAAQNYVQTARSQYNGSFPATFNEKLYFGKLTYFATPDDTINLSAFIRRESNLQINGGITTTDASARARNNEERYEGWWTHRGSNWVNELYIARDAAANGLIPNTAGPSYVVTYAVPVVGSPTPVGCITVNGSSPAAYTCPQTGNPQQIQLGALNFVQDDHQYQSLIKDNVTINAGSHTIKFGGTINFTKLQRLEQRSGNGLYYFDAANFTGVGTSTPYAAEINIAPAVPATAKNTQIGLFVQDSWRPDDHWQVNYGLRWDYESNATNEKFVTPPAAAAALRVYPGWAAAGINPEDYISTGHNRKPFLGEFQPRLGVSYDLHGDRDIVLFAGAGRYYDRSLFIDTALETIDDYYSTIVPIRACQGAGDTNCVPGPLPTDPNALRALAAGQSGNLLYLLNNHTKIPYSDEVDAGIRKRFGAINTSITFSYIRSNNIFQVVMGNRLPSGNYSDIVNQVINYNGIPFTAGDFYNGEADALAPLPGFGRIVIGNSDGKARYLAVYLQADKPYTDLSGWGFSTALTISSARSNDSSDTGQIGDPFYFDSPMIGQLGWGPVRGLERWRFVGTGTVKIPFDIKLSTVVTLSSGPSYGAVLCCNVPASVAGENGVAYFTNFGVYRPRGIAYKNIDFNISKSFKMPWNRGQELTVYFQALNAFDFVNRNYSMWTGGFQNYGGSPSHAHDPGSVASQGRNFKIGAKFTF
ncbi:MAG: TonB-dependent receptor plug domain-containing protein [Sphingomicrobium sp.]